VVLAGEPAASPTKTSGAEHHEDSGDPGRGFADAAVADAVGDPGGEAHGEELPRGEDPRGVVDAHDEAGDGVELDHADAGGKLEREGEVVHAQEARGGEEDADAGAADAGGGEERERQRGDLSRTRQFADLAAPGSVHPVRHRHVRQGV
jgi:hypothetical protein